MKWKKTNKKTEFKRYICYGALILFAITFIIAGYAWLQPSAISKDITNNDITIETTYDYKATMKKSTLYPDGGVIDVDETIIKNATENIPFTISTSIKADETIDTDLSQGLQIKLIAGNYWDKTYILEEKKQLTKSGKEITLFKDNEYKINIEELSGFINEVEEEIYTRPEVYTIQVTPIIQGTLTHNGVTQEIDVSGNVLAFNMHYSDIVLASEKEYSSNHPFNTTINTPNTLSLFGFAFSPKTLALISTIVSILFLLIAISNLKFIRNTYKRDLLPSEKINIKYNKRIIPLTKSIHFQQNSIINLPSFKSLVQISDIKDLQIFSFKESNISYYFLIDEGVLFQFILNETDIIITEGESNPNYAMD